MYLERGGDGEEAGRDGADDEAGSADAGEHPEGRRPLRLGDLVSHVGEREAHHGALRDHRRQRLGDVVGVEVWPRLVKRQDG